MDYQFKILGSSSSGNCSLLKTPHTNILIDAGFSAKRIQALLEANGEYIRNISAIFITHEHSDHCTGLKGLSRFPHLKVFANKSTAKAIQPMLSRPISWEIFQTGSTFEYRDIKIETFSIPHDAADPVGFVFKCSVDIAWVTDLGFVPKLIQEKVRQAQILVVESNYDPELLDQDYKRPWSIKQRIKGRLGHLSNFDTYNFLSDTENTNWEKIYLAHISKDCNNTDIIDNQFDTLKKTRNFDLEIVNPHTVFN